jgi:hypothetical protein
MGLSAFVAAPPPKKMKALREDEGEDEGKEALRWRYQTC